MSSKRIKLLMSAESSPYAKAMAMIADGALPEKHKEYFKENINYDDFISGIGSSISEAIDINAFNAHGKRLQAEFAAQGYIKDIETGKAMTIQESLSLLRVFGLVGAAGRKSLSMCFNESPRTLISEANFNKNEDIARIKGEAARIEAELGPENTKRGRELIVSLTRISDSMNKFQGVTKVAERELEDKAKAFLEILHELGRLFNSVRVAGFMVGLSVGVIGSVINGTIGIGGVPVVIGAIMVHPLVISSVIVGFLSIYGTKNIPVLKEIEEIGETFLAKLLTGSHPIDFIKKTFKDLIHGDYVSMDRYKESPICECLFGESKNPTELQIAALEKNLKKETAELEEKIGSESTAFVRKKVEELKAVRDEIKNLKDGMDAELEAKIKYVLDIAHQLFRIFTVANITTMIVSGDFIPVLAADPFTTAYFCHPVVIAAIVIDIIWIIGPKNIPILGEVFELVETMIAKFGVGVNNALKTAFNSLRDGIKSVMGKKTFSESISTLTAADVEVKLAKSKDVPAAIKEVLDNNTDIKDFSKSVYKSIIVDLKKDAVETDKLNRVEADEVSKIKTDITDSILSNIAQKDATMAAGILGKLGSDEVAEIPATEGAIEEGADPASATPATGDTDGDGDFAEEALTKSPMDDTADEEADAMKALQESPIFKRRRELLMQSKQTKFNIKETSYLDVLKSLVQDNVISSLEN